MAKLSLFTLALMVALLSAVSAQKGYVTYHQYTSNYPLSSCACSDGANGLITKTKQSTVAKWFPNVAAASFATWNSPNCGGCYQLTYKGKSVKVTVIDQCAAQGGYNAHFDVAPGAFSALAGSLTAGHIEVTYSKVSSNPCS